MKLALAVTGDDGAWRDEARCKGVDPEMFYPGRGARRVDVGTPRDVCDACPVAAPCLAYALMGTWGKFGVWGRTSEKDRRRIRRAWDRDLTRSFVWPEALAAAEEYLSSVQHRGAA